MVNNSSNINKANNHPSPSLTEHNENTTTYDVWYPGAGLGQTQNCGGLMGFQPSPPDNWISNSNAYINNKKKPAQILFHSKGPHAIIKMNNSIYTRTAHE